MKDLIILSCLLVLSQLLGAQELVFECLELEKGSCELLILDQNECIGSDTTHQSYVLDADTFKKLADLRLPIDTVEYRCGSTHRLFFLRGDSVVSRGQVILDCGQLKVGESTFHFTSEMLDYWKSLGEGLEKSYYSFSSLPEGRTYYDKYIRNDSSVVVKEILEPKWVLYDGWFAVSIDDIGNEGFEALINRIRQRLDLSKMLPTFFYIGGTSDLSVLKLKLYSNHSIYRTFEPLKYGLNDYKGKWKPARKFELNVFRRKD